MMLDKLKAQWTKANKAYNNNKAIMSDAAFNEIETKIEKLDPKWLKAQGTGAKVDKKTDIELTYFMPSLHKKYPDKIDAWVQKQDRMLLLMDKLDGSAIQVEFNKGKPLKAVTRGDGITGGDISFLIPHLNIPKTIPTKDHVVLRCEAVLKAKTFAKKYAEEADNARAAVNGWLNRMKPAAGLKDVDIVVLGVYNRTMLDGLKKAKSWGFATVAHTVMVKTLAIKQLQRRREESEYDIDGLVLCSPTVGLVYDNADKPKWIIAYKENESVADATEAKVKKIIWQESRKSLLVPKIEIHPIRLGGTTVTFCTAHNAQWMLDRGIGPGAVVKIVRSGDVIPKIVDVVKKGKIQLPDVDHELMGVHFVAIERTLEADVRAIHHFFSTLGIEFIAAKTIEKLHAIGFTHAHEYLKEWEQNNVEPFEDTIGTAMTRKIFKEFDRVFGDGVLLRDLMVASNTMCAGIGERKLKAIEAHYKDVPNILAELVKGKDAFIKLRVSKVAGFKGRTIGLLIDSLTNFRPWLRHALKYIKVKKPARSEVVVRKGKLMGERVSFTGYRDDAEKEWIIKNGGEVIDFGARTTILLFRPNGKASAKVKKASDKGVKTLLFKDLK